MFYYILLAQHNRRSCCALAQRMYCRLPVLQSQQGGTRAVYWVNHTAGAQTEGTVFYLKGALETLETCELFRVRTSRPIFFSFRSLYRESLHNRYVYRGKTTTERRMAKVRESAEHDNNPTRSGPSAPSTTVVVPDFGEQKRSPLKHIQEENLSRGPPD